MSPRPRATRTGTVRAAVFGLVCALALAACDDSGSAAAGPERAPTTVAPVPAPSDGVLRARIDGSSAHDPAVDDVVLVGDSVLALVADELAGMLGATLDVDAADCRQLADAVSGPCGGVPPGATVESGIEAIERSLSSRVEAPDAAVFVLANNASLDAGQLDAAMNASAGIDQIWWVNARIDGFGRQDINNRLLDELATRDQRARVVDWFSASEGADLLADNVHPNAAGQQRLARLIADHVRGDRAL